jgi:hypothetical protein
MTADERRAIIENINANRKKALEAMKEAAQTNPHMDPKMREAILKLK